jgi:8-oxo-dGTP pyrophosphatase MutT (NUDIX family)
MRRGAAAASLHRRTGGLLACPHWPDGPAPQGPAAPEVDKESPPRPSRPGGARGGDEACTVQYVGEPSKWVVLDERLVDDTPHIRVSQADIELPDGVRFTQYVFRIRRCAMTAVLDERGERMLLMRRHRFIVDRWVWELPGGYVDEGEDPAAAAVREVVEETGWRPRGVEFVMSCQPLIGNADYRQDLFVARGADRVGEPEADETAEVQWVAVEDLAGLIAGGEILGAMTIIGVQHVLLRRAGARLPGL